VLCFATNCAEMAAFGRAKEHVFRGFLKLRHAIPSHDTGPVTLSCRPKCSFRPPCVRKPRGFSSRGLSDGGAGYRSR
jgi:hypothetical protein